MKNIKKIVNECVKKYLAESFNNFDDELAKEYLTKLNQVSSVLTEANEQINKKMKLFNLDINYCKKFLNSLNFNLILSNEDMTINDGIKLTYKIEGSENWSEEEASRYSQMLDKKFNSFKQSLNYDSNLYIGLQDDDISEIYVVISDRDDEYSIFNIISYLNNIVKK